MDLRPVFTSNFRLVLRYPPEVTLSHRHEVEMFMCGHFQTTLKGSDEEVEVQWYPTGKKSFECISRLYKYELAQVVEKQIRAAANKCRITEVFHISYALVLEKDANDFVETTSIDELSFISET